MRSLLPFKVIRLKLELVTAICLYYSTLIQIPWDTFHGILEIKKVVKTYALQQNPVKKWKVDKENIFFLLKRLTFCF